MSFLLMYIEEKRKVTIYFSIINKKLDAVASNNCTLFMCNWLTLSYIKN